MTQLSIIVVNYNTRKFTIDCINSLKRNYPKELRSGEFELIVVDNNSSDNSGDALKKVSEITFIQNEENYGFSKANNIGLKISSGRYVLFLNSDTIVNDKVLNEVVRFMNSNKKVGASTCRVVLPNGMLDEASHRGFPTPWNALCYFAGLEKIFPHSRVFSGYHMGWKNMSENHEIDVIAGSFMFVRREAGEEAGWWDEDYFFYGEDIDFCYMLKKKGWRIFYLAGFSIIHLKGVSGGIKKISKDITTANKDTRIKATKSRFRAMQIFYNKHYVEKYPFWLTSLVMLTINIRLWYNLRKLEE